MNISSPKFWLALVGAVALFSGCMKKPRPVPADTMMGGGAANSAINPQEYGNFPGQSATGLQPRPASEMTSGNQVRGLLKSVYFDFDKSAIRQDQRDKITAAADYLNKNPQDRMLLEGHCDWRGTAEYNLALGDRRARSVQQFLVDLGVPASRLETLSKGSIGAVENGTKAQMAHDRRVDFVILKAQSAPAGG